MKKWLLAIALSLVMAISLLPDTAWAAEEPGSSPENPLAATQQNGAFIFNPESRDYTLYGISREWFKEHNPDGGILYISVTIPADVEVISPYCMTNTDTAEKAEHDVVSEADGLGTFEVVSVDFSAASYLKTIGDYAFYDCQNMTGTFDMSNTEYMTVIGDYAFYNCSNMTGDIDMSASWELKEIGDYAFYNCSSLTGALSFGENHWYGPFDRIGEYAFYNCQKITGVDMSSANSSLSEIGDYAFYNCVNLAYFDWPSYGYKTVIGESAFENCTSLQFVGDVLPHWVDEIGKNAFRNAFSGDTRIYLGNGVKKIGANAFASDRISQIVFEEDRRNEYEYDVSAFETGSPSLLIVFEDQIDYTSFLEERNPSADLKKRLAYPVTIRFNDETAPNVSSVAQTKLNHQSIAYEKAGDFWVYNENYELPVIQKPISAAIGYTSGWTNENVILNENIILNFSDDVVNRIYTFTPTTEPVLLNPTIVPTVNDVEQESFSDLVVTLGEGTSTVGVSVSHPLLRSDAGTEEDYVYFEYAWWDEKDNRVNGPRNETEGDLFSNVPEPGVYARDWTERASIPITSTEHTRTGGDGYLVEIRGIHVKNGEKEVFYKSHENFIHFGSDHDTEATVQDVYVLQVTVKEAPVYTIKADPAELDFGSVQTGYTQPAAQPVTITNTGNQELTVTLPTSEPYTISGSGEGWNENGSITLATGDSATFTVRPNTGLGTGTYDETLTVTGTKGGNSAQASVSLAFTVEQPYIPPVVNPDPEEPKPDPTPDYVPEGLNTEDHYAYLIGNGGLIRPEDDITRAEVAAIFFRLLTDETRQAYWSIQSGFTDVSEGNWFNTAVSTLTNLGVLHGYQDGSFQPNAPISRAEFTAIATRFFDYTAEYEDGTFPDVHESNWYADEVQAAVDMGLIQGYPTGVFAPGDSITRGEACAIVNRVLNRRPHEEHLLDREEMNTWPDNTGDRWFYEDVQEASNTHDYDWILEDGQTVEEWTAKLPDPDWAAIEYGG